MDSLAEKLDAKLRQWEPETADHVRRQVTEIIEMADQDVLDVLRSRAVVQEVLDLLDEPATGVEEIAGKSWTVLGIGTAVVAFRFT